MDIGIFIIFMAWPVLLVVLGGGILYFLLEDADVSTVFWSWVALSLISTGGEFAYSLVRELWR